MWVVIVLSDTRYYLFNDPCVSYYDKEKVVFVLNSQGSITTALEINRFTKMSGVLVIYHGLDRLFSFYF